MDEDEGDDEGELEVSLGEVKDSVDFKVAVLVVDELTSMVAKGTGGEKMAVLQCVVGKLSKIAGFLDGGVRGGVGGGGGDTRWLG